MVVPTYQERANIGHLLERIGAALSERDYEIVIVDDNSPDGTAEAAASLANRYPVRVIKREGARGLGSAVLEGFRKAEGGVIAVIDADLQHPPEVVLQLTAALENGVDIAVASRYVSGGGIRDWSLPRRLVSRAAILLARPLTKVKDPVSGCFMVKREVVEGNSFSPRGYKILLEILVKGTYRHVGEVPYIFGSRQAGESKLSLMEYLRYLMLLGGLYWYKLGHLRRRSNTC